MPNQGKRLDQLNGDRSLPDFSKCRARRFGDSDVVYCLADDFRNCVHALSFSSGTFCLHPEREKFIVRARTAMRN